MTVFKVGDIVRTDTSVPFRVAKADATHVRDETGKWYYNGTLTLVVTHKFKVGDVVRFNPSWSAEKWIIDALSDKIGCYDVTHYLIASNKLLCQYMEECELVELAHKFKVGDMVRFPKNPDAGVWKIVKIHPTRTERYEIELPGQPETRCFDQDMSACVLAHKFKVGDVVLPIEGYMRSKVAKPAKVVEVRECDGYVRIDTCAPWFLNPDALKHCETVRIECDLTTGTSRVVMTADNSVSRFLEQGRVEMSPGLNKSTLYTLRPTIKTSRRVKEGSYGIVTAYYVDGQLRTEFTKSNGTADELREAAHVLNQIAEVIDDE